MPSIGLRTLLLAQRYLSEREYNEWTLRYTEGMKALVDREQIMEEL